MTLVLDSSAVVAATAGMAANGLEPPSDLFEASNLLRRLVLAGVLTSDLRALATRT